MTMLSISLKVNYLYYVRMAANIMVIIQFYPEKDSDRLEEITTCILNNLRNPHVRTVLNLRESPDDVIPEEIASHPKWKEYPLHKRVMFEDVFRVANEVTKPYQRCCFMNLDIMLDEDSRWHDYTGENNVVLCLSRYDLNENMEPYTEFSLEKNAYCTAQDAWMWVTPLAELKETEFSVGCPGCDNAIAERFRRAGYTPVNWSNKFKIYHYDVCRKNNPTKMLLKNTEYSRVCPEQQGQWLVPRLDAAGTFEKLATKIIVSRSPIDPNYLGLNLVMTKEEEHKLCDSLLGSLIKSHKGMRLVKVHQLIGGDESAQKKYSNTYLEHQASMTALVGWLKNPINKLVFSDMCKCIFFQNWWEEYDAVASVYSMLQKVDNRKVWDSHDSGTWDNERLPQTSEAV